MTSKIIKSQTLKLFLSMTAQPFKKNTRKYPKDGRKKWGQNGLHFK